MEDVPEGENGGSKGLEYVNQDLGKGVRLQKRLGPDRGGP